MKTRALLLILFVLAQILWGVSSYKQNRKAPVSQISVHRHNQNTIMNKSHLRFPNHRLPKLPESRDRSWRLRELLTDYLDDMEFVPDYKYVIQYQNSSPACIDSVEKWFWDDWVNQWVYYGCLKYTYDITAEYITSKFSYYGSDSYPQVKMYFFYDNQNRMEHVVFYLMQDEVNVHSYDRVSFEYAMNSMAQINAHYINYEFPDESYTRVMFTHDNLGRIKTANAEYSVDSLSWNIDSYDSLAYHVNDTSTGLSQIQYMSKNLAGATSLSYIDTGFFYDFPMGSMLSQEYYFEEWEDTYWDDMQKSSFSYNAQNQIDNIVGEYYYLGGWYPEERRLYHYDANSNLNHIDNQMWEDDLSIWDEITHHEYYTWEQFSSSDDENQETPALPVILAYPNPFYTETRIDCSLPQSAEIYIYNLKGQLIRRLKADKGNPVTWDGKDDSGKDTAAGIYLIRIKSGRQNLCSKVLHIK